MSARQDLEARSFAFAASVLGRFRQLISGGPAHAHMALQLFRAASSLGAQLEEAEVFASRRDPAAKIAIALREARESKYWLRLLDTDSAWSGRLTDDIRESSEFVAMLTTSLRKLRNAPDT